MDRIQLNQQKSIGKNDQQRDQHGKHPVVSIEGCYPQGGNRSGKGLILQWNRPEEIRDPEQKRDQHKQDKNTNTVAVEKS